MHLIKQWLLMCPCGLNLYVRIMITNCSRCLEANNLPDEKRLLIYKIYFITIMKHAYTDNIQNDHHVYGCFFYNIQVHLVKEPISTCLFSIKK